MLHTGLTLREINYVLTNLLLSSRDKSWLKAVRRIAATRYTQ
jgi:hypothetical protein